MAYVENLEYENLNSLRNYPIREGINPTDITSTFSIPNNFILDFQLAATSDVTKNFFISQILNEPTSIVLQISDNSSVVVGSFTIPISGFTDNSDYTLQTVPGAYAFANGKITIGTIISITNQPTGIYSFVIGATQFEPRTIILAISGINQITFSDPKGTQQTLSGNVNIVARNNLRYSYNNSTNYLILDAGDGLGLNIACTSAPCIQKINGVTPDPDTGNISFIGVGCSGITSTVVNTLQINDTCCTPCSGCDDLAELTNRLNTLESRYLDLKQQYGYLNSELGVYLSTVNSAGCVCD